MIEGTSDGAAHCHQTSTLHMLPRCVSSFHSQSLLQLPQTGHSFVGMAYLFTMS